MDFSDIARMIAALAVTLGLIGLAAAAARRYAPGALARLKPGAPRRLAIIESLVLDPARRLVLVRFDKEERLILLGEGRMLEAPAAPPAAAAPSARRSRKTAP
jgi:flagellar protein FliO/FliZ